MFPEPLVALEQHWTHLPNVCCKPRWEQVKLCIRGVDGGHKQNPPTKKEETERPRVGLFLLNHHRNLNQSNTLVYILAQMIPH